jgi:Phosphotransferase enzyme family
MLTMTSNSEEISRKLGKPLPNSSLVKNACSQAWGVHTEIQCINQLESYDDANFHIDTAIAGICNENTASSTKTPEYLLKFYNAVESNNTEMLVGISQLLRTVSSYCEISACHCFNHPIVPVPIATAVEFRTQLEDTFSCKSVADDLNKSFGFEDSIEDVAFCKICPRSDGTINDRIAARLFHWIPGPTLNKAGEPTDATPMLVTNVGFALGSISNSLRNFDHTAFHRYHSWDLQNFAYVAETFSCYIEEPDIREFVQLVLKSFCNHVLPLSHTFRKSVIMGDCNDANVIINSAKTAVVGIIDFGDAVHTWSINEVAIALAYSMLTDYGRSEPLRSISCLFGGFIYAVTRCRDQADVNGEVYSSSGGTGCTFTNELPNLHTLICVRLCVSIMIGAYSISKDPTNEYLKLHAHPAKEALRTMLKGAGTGSSLSAPGADASATHALHPTSLLRLFTRVSEEIMARGSHDGPALASLFIQIASEHGQ